MKNLYKYLIPAAATLAALVSCQRENLVNDTLPENAVTIRVHATADDLKGIDPDGKTYIADYQGQANTILWGTGEYMKLALTAGETTTFANSTDASADTFNGEPEALFEFSVAPETASEYVYQGLYPASAAAPSNNTNAANYKVNLPTVQNATASSYDPAAYIMVVKPETFTSVQTDWEASFRRGTALNKITLKNLPSGVSIERVKITAEGKKLAGGRHFNLTTGEGSDVYGVESTIEVKYATALTGTNVDVWFTSWDAEIAVGEKLTVVAYTTDNKSYTKEITVPAGRSIKFQEGFLNITGVSMSGISPEEVTTIEGDYVILAKHNDTYYALKGEASTTRIASVDYTGSTTSYAGDASIIWTIATSGSGYTIKNGSNYIGWTSGNSADLVDETDYDATKCLMTIDKDGDVYHIKVNADQSRVLAKNTGANYFAFYASTGQYSDIVLVPATALETVATPTFSPAAGEVTSGTEVTISTTTSGATIYYTTDGSDPTTSSTQGTSVTITAATTIKAIAVKEGMANSEVATALYTIAGTIDYPSLETSNVTLTAGTNGSSATVNEEEAIKVGTTKKGGDLTVTVPAGTTKLHLHAAAWNGVTGLSLDISGANVSPASIALTADSGISGNSPFTLAGNPEDFYFVLELSNITADTDITFTSSIAKRFVVWGVNAEAGASVTWNLASISITTAPTKTTYTAGETFDPAGMVVTGHFVDANDATNTKDEAVTGYTISPDGALATTDTQVTITYQGKTTTQAITVTAPTYAFETIAELNALAEQLKDKETASYSGRLDNAVVSYVPNTSNAIVKDASGSILVFKSGHGYQQGQTYTGGLQVTVKMYYTTIEITEIDASFTGSQTTIQPATMTISALEGNFSTYQNAYVKLENLTVTARDAKNITVSDGTKTYQVYDDANNSSAGVGDVITAVGTVADHNGTNQIKVWDSTDITITAVAPKAITFSRPAAGGSFTVSVGGNNITSGTKVVSGTTVTLTATAASGYSFESWTVTGATVANASAATTTFTMGSSAVTISASFVSQGSSLQYTLDGTDNTQGSNGYATDSEITQSSIGWIAVANTTISPWRFGGKNLSGVNRAVYSTTAIDSNISSIEVESGTATATVNSLTITVHNSAADAASGSNAIATKSVTSGITSSTVTLTKTDATSWAGKYYRIVYNVTCGGSNQYVQFRSAKFYGTN